MTAKTEEKKKQIRITLWDSRNFCVEILPQPVDAYLQVVTTLRYLPEKKWSKQQEAYRVPITDKNVQFLLDRFPIDSVEIDDEAKIMLRHTELTTKVAINREKRRWNYLFNDEVPEDVEWVCPTKPYRHQLVAADAMKDMEFFAQLMEQGTGKTLVVINEMARCAMKRAEKEEAPFKVLLIVPQTLVGNWMLELEKHLPKDLSVYTKALGMKWVGLGHLVEGMRSDAKLKVFLTNPERCNSIKDGLLAMDWDLVVVDESNTIKNPKAKRTKVVHEIGDKASRRVILTGTIMANSILDVWSQFQFLSPGALGYDSFYSFRNHYTEFARAGNWDKITGQRNLDELKERMSRHSFIVKKEQCLDLPPKQYTRVPVEMGKTQQKLYDEMLNYAVAELDGEEMEARAAIAVLIRLAQISSGFIRTPEGQTIRIPDGSAKADVAVELISNSVGKVIVWCRFREDIDYLVHRLEKIGVKSVVMHGGVSAHKIVGHSPEGRPISERDEAVRRFNEDDEVKVMVGDPGTGGVGLTLLGSQEFPCTATIYYSHDWSLAEREQSEDRNHRIGQNWPVTYYDLTCNESIDETIVEALLAKKNLSEALKDVSTIKDLLLSSRRGRPTQRPSHMQKDTSTMRHWLNEKGIAIPCEPGQEEGCDSFDHNEEKPTCPHCDGNPLSVSEEAFRRFVRSGVVIK